MAKGQAVTDDEARQVIANLERGATLVSERDRLGYESSLTVRHAVVRLIGEERTRELIRTARTRAVAARHQLKAERKAQKKGRGEAAVYAFAPPDIQVGRAIEVAISGSRVVVAQRIGDVIRLTMARRINRTLSDALVSGGNVLLAVNKLPEIMDAMKQAAR